VVDITIDWAERYDPSSVQLGELAQLRILSTLCFADALPECQYNWGIIMLLRRFWKIPALFITIIYPNVSILYSPVIMHLKHFFIYLNITVSTSNCKFVTKTTLEY